MQLCLSFLDQQHGAVINGPYRYLLWRIWDPRQSRLLWVMLNPSTADETTNDPTLRRILGFSRASGFGGLEVVNLFALRSPSPKALLLAPDAVGPENDRYIQEAVTRAEKIVAAWGNEGARDGRERAVLSRISRPVFCLGTTNLGHPRHPLYVKAQTELCPLERIQHWSGEDRLACQQQKADGKSTENTFPRQRKRCYKEKQTQEAQ